MGIIFLILGNSTTMLYAQAGNIVHAAGPVYMVRSNSRIGNPSSALSIGNDGVLVIDSNLLDTQEFIREVIDSLGSERIKLLVNTHAHADHTEGNVKFGQEATIIARKELRQRLLTEGLYETGGETIAPIGLPSVTIERETSLHFNGEEVRVIPLSPGHTDNDLIVYFTKSNVLCVGDYYFVEKFPVFDFEGGADIKGYLNNIRWIFESFPGEAVIIPGHGYFDDKAIQTFSMSQYKAWYADIKESIGYITEELRSGRSIAQIQSSSIPRKYQSFDAKPRFISWKRWVETVANDFATRSDSELVR